MEDRISKTFDATKAYLLMICLDKDVRKWEKECGIGTIHKYLALLNKRHNQLITIPYKLTRTEFMILHGKLREQEQAYRARKELEKKIIPLSVFEGGVEK